jgi:hypothetical protein
METRLRESTPKYPRRTAVRLSGKETISHRTLDRPVSVLEFWAWSCSDLLSNVTRGRFAEFLVARALGLSTDGVRDEWSVYDLELPGGDGIEVKSAAYLQSWGQRGLSRTVFDIRRSRAWDPKLNVMAAESDRPAKVYVFALLKHEEKTSVDPLKIEQWEFFVLPTSTINERLKAQRSITLASLRRLAGTGVGFADLAKRVAEAANLS